MSSTRMTGMTRTLAALALLAALPALALKGTIEVKSEVMKETVVTAADGSKSTRLVPAPHAAPGQEVVFVTTVRNVGTQPAEHLVIDNPVPAELIYKSSGGDTADTLVSADGKTFEHLERLQLKGADGASRSADAGDVRFLRWTLNQPIKPGESTRVTFRAAVK